MDNLHFDDVLDLALQLPPTQQARLLIYLAASVQDTLAAQFGVSDEDQVIARRGVELLEIDPPESRYTMQDGESLLAAMGMDDPPTDAAPPDRRGW